MKVFQNRAVAAVLMVLAIAASVAIGQAKKPDLSVEPSTKVVGSYTYTYDEAGILSDKTMEHIDAMNASLFAQTGAQIMVKTVSTTNGQDILDYAIDLRKGSETYLKWVAVELSADNKRELFIPRGFGHVFVTLEENCEVNYKVDNVYSKENERSIRYDDPQIGLVWPEGMVPVLSEKDKNAPLLRDCDCDFTI